MMHNRARRWGQGLLGVAVALVAAACGDGDADDFIWGRTPAWVGPAGGTVVYSQNLSTPSDRFTNTVTSLDTGAVFAIDIAGGPPRKLTDSDRGPDFFPVPSPDGSQIAFVSAEDDQFDIYVMDIDGDNRRRLTFDRATDTTPSWTADGRAVLFVSDRGGSADIWRIGADGSGLVQLTSFAGDEAAPRMSPDGTRIAFASNQDRGNFDLWVMDAPGGNPRQLTRKDRPSSPIADGSPSWSPDGARLVFERWDGDWDIYRIDADGTGTVALTDHREHDGDPAFSPDGRRVAFTSARDGWWQVWLMDPDGGNLTQLTGR